MKNSLFVLGIVVLITSACAGSKKKNQDLALEIPLETVRELTLAKPLEAGRKAHVSAASGIIKVGEIFYVVSDDELSLFSFAEKDAHLKPVRMIEGQLPADKAKRKDDKPDFESIALLSKSDWPPHGALVAWPSASTPKRTQAVIFPLDKNQKPSKPVVSNILPLAYELQSDTKELNIEGILVRDDKVFMFQRGNSKKGKNGFAEISLKNWTSGIKKGDWSGKLKFESVKMGKLSGVNIGFSDVIWTKYGLLALGSAEDSESTFADGQVYGTVLVRIVGDKSEIIGKFQPTAKLEGIYASETADGLDLYVVDDADDSDKPSRLYKAKIPAALLDSVKHP